MSAALERGEQVVHADRLADVVVHAGGEARLAIALHGVGGHGDDAWTAPAASTARECAAVASRPSISGICTSINTTSYGCRSSARDRLQPIARHVRAVAELRQQAQGELLVDGVVLGEQDAQRATLGQLRAGRGTEPLSRRRGVHRLLLRTDFEQCVEQVAMA